MLADFTRDMLDGIDPAYHELWRDIFSKISLLAFSAEWARFTTEDETGNRPKPKRLRDPAKTNVGREFLDFIREFKQYVHTPGGEA
jgi:hypothetical protein